ncbi:MAG: hypothetical protein KH254_04455 [Alistipes putredinis]|nr:hypothetical protein [Alistipes putredinis]
MVGAIKEREKELFERWCGGVRNEDRSAVFVKDGLVDEERWLTTSPRIVFVLKEAHGRDNRDFDLVRDCLGGRSTVTTWGNVARWAYGIRELWRTGEVVPYTDVRNRGTDEKQRREQLKSLCVMNISKVPGRSRTNTRNLTEKFRKFNKSYFAEQFDLYREHTDLVICCGAAVARLFLLEINPLYGYEYSPGHGAQPEGGYWYYRIEGGPYVVSVPHPQASIRCQEMYGKLMRTVRILRLIGTSDE